MANNFLCLNSDETEVMLIGSPHQLSGTYQSPLIIDGSVLEFQKKLRNLGLIFDSSVTFDTHI